MYYPFRQNNSGGSFSGPAVTVWIEADNAGEANNIFTTLDDCYFDPDYQRDCKCCGTRWFPTDEYYGKSHYDMLKEVDRENESRMDSLNELIGRNKLPQHMIRHKNGHNDFI